MSQSRQSPQGGEAVNTMCMYVAVFGLYSLTMAQAFITAHLDFSKPLSIGLPVSSFLPSDQVTQCARVISLKCKPQLILTLTFL